MAEIILPPEENEETPQLPELNIDKPTENSKVITIEFEAKKTNKVSTKDTNQQLYTTDTDAWFEFKETSLEGANGTYSVVFINRHDGSIFHRTGDIVSGVAYYKIPHQEIRHAGAWRGQIVYTLSNGDTTSREFGYDVKGHILDGKDVREIVVEDFETLMSQLRSMKDNAEQELAGLVNTANQNETDRQAFFDDLVEGIDDLQANYQELLDTGVLQTNINTKLEQLEEEYAPKLTEVTAQLAQNESQLNQKPNRTDTGWASLNILTEEERAKLLGLEPGEINAVLGEGNVLPENTSFFKVGKNLFNNTDVVVGKLLASNGATYDNSSFSTTNFIEIKSNKQYATTDLFTVSFYDNEEKQIIQHAPPVPLTFVSPPNAVYARISVNNDKLGTAQIEEGNARTAYEPHRRYIPKSYTEKHDVEIDDIKDNSISFKKTNFVKSGKNLFNKNEILNGYYVNEVYGALGANEAQFTSDFIEVEQKKLYSLNVSNVSLRIGFYSESKGFMSGLLNPEIPILIPEGTHYVRFSAPNTVNIHSVQFEQNNVSTTFEPWGLEIPDLLTDKEATKSVEVNLPSKLYAMVGQEMNIYFDNIINGRDTEYEFDITCVIGKQFQNFYRVVPVDAGNYSIKIDVFKDNELVASKSSKITVSSQAVGEGVTKKILKVGDSTTDNGNGINKLVENFNDDAMSIQVIGTRGAVPYLHEGRSGWTSERFVSEGSPFWNPSTESFDFNYYIENNNLEAPDYVFINLGVNDMFQFSSDSSLETGISNAIGNYNEMIENIQVFDSNIKLVLGLTIPPNYSQDAFGKAYNSNQNRRRYKRNNFYWVKEMITVFDNRETENIYLSPIYTNLDTRYNMGLEETSVNARNPLTYTSPIGNGGVHPVESGYWQIADVEYFFLKSLEV